MSGKNGTETNEAFVSPAEVLRHIGSPFAPDKETPLPLTHAAWSIWKHREVPFAEAIVSAMSCLLSVEYNGTGPVLVKAHQQQPFCSPFHAETKEEQSSDKLIIHQK